MAGGSSTEYPALLTAVAEAQANLDAAHEALAQRRNAVLQARALADASKVLDPDDPHRADSAAALNCAHAAYLEALHFTLPQAVRALDVALAALRRAAPKEGAKV